MSTTRGSTRSLTEGALIAALAVLLVLMAQFLPLVGSVIIFLWPVPIIVIILRQGFRTGVLTVITAGLVLSAVVGVIQGSLVALTMGASGLVFGLGWLRQWRAGTMLAAASVALLGATLVGLAASKYLLEIDLLALSLETMEQAINASISLYQRLGMEQQADLLEEMLVMTREFMPVFLPASLLMASVVHAYLNLVVAGSILRRLDYTVPALPAFGRWKLPFFTLIIYAASAGALMLVVDGPLYRVVVNVYYFLNIVFIVQGASLIYYFLGRWQLPRLVAVLLIAFTVMSLSIVYMFAGIAEVAFDIRHMVERRDREKSKLGEKEKRRPSKKK